MRREICKSPQILKTYRQSGKWKTSLNVKGEETKLSLTVNALKG